MHLEETLAHVLNVLRQQIHTSMLTTFSQLKKAEHRQAEVLDTAFKEAKESISQLTAEQQRAVSKEFNAVCQLLTLTSFSKAGSKGEVNYTTTDLLQSLLVINHTIECLEVRRHLKEGGAAGLRFHFYPNVVEPEKQVLDLGPVGVHYAHYSLTQGLQPTEDTFPVLYSKLDTFLRETFEDFKEQGTTVLGMDFFQDGTATILTHLTEIDELGTLKVHFEFYPIYQ